MAHAAGTFASGLVSDPFRPLRERVFDLLEVEPGTVLLDLSPAFGELALAAARFSRGRGSATAAGPVWSALCEKKREVERTGVGGVLFVGSSPTALPFGRGVFDSAAYVADPVFPVDLGTVLDELRRVSRSGAVMVLGTWLRPSPFLRLAEGLCRRACRKAGRELPGFSGVGSPEELALALKAAGLRSVEAEAFPFRLVCARTGALWHLFLDVTPLGRVLGYGRRQALEEIRFFFEKEAREYVRLAANRLEIDAPLALARGTN